MYNYVILSKYIRWLFPLGNNHKLTHILWKRQQGVLYV